MKKNEWQSIIEDIDEVNIIKDPITSEVEFEVYDKITGPDVKVRDKNMIEAIQTLFLLLLMMVLMHMDVILNTNLHYL